MAELVRVPVAEAGTLAQRREPMGEVVRVQRSADLTRKDQAVILPRLAGCQPFLSLPSPMPAQQLQQLGA
ncbi:hypothetical protein B0E53_00429 [Micromonospora sp. MH33]|nr:hypothetical protein B0E53_00429 [Micromonospora sp. MH33]